MRRNADAGLRDLERRVRATGADADARAYAVALLRAGLVTLTQAEIDTLDRMGVGAWFAWTVAGEHEWRPATKEAGESYAEQTQSEDDCGACHGTGQAGHDVCAICEGTGARRVWARFWSVSGLAVRRAGGAPMIVRTYWAVDDEDNWNSTIDDEVPVGSHESERSLATRMRDTARSWHEYSAWVEEFGEDPIGELGPLGALTPWRFELEQEQSRGRTARAQISGRVLLRKASRRQGRRWVAAPLIELPDEVTTWLMAVGPPVSLRVHGTGASRPALVSGITSLAALRSGQIAGGRITKDNEFRMTVEVDIQIGPTRQWILDNVGRYADMVIRRLGEAERRLMAAERAIERSRPGGTWARRSLAPSCPATCPRCGNAGSLHHEGGSHYCTECDALTAGHRLVGCPGVEGE